MDDSNGNNKELFLMFTKIKSAIMHSLQETTHIDYELKFEDNSFRVYLLSEKDVYLSLTVYDNDCCVSIFKDGCRLTKSHILDYFGSKMLHNLQKAFDDTRTYYNKINGIDTSNEQITNENMFENFNDIVGCIGTSIHGIKNVVEDEFGGAHIEY